MKKYSLSLVLLFLFFALGFLFPKNTFAVTPPSLSFVVIQNPTSSSVVLYVTGLNFSSFVSTTGYNADSTDLNKITYNGAHPISAVIDETGGKHITATFAIPSSTTGKSGGSFTIEAGTIKNNGGSNVAQLTVLDASITDSASPVLAEVTPIGDTSSDTTPNYTFSSTEAGTITYGGDCSSDTTSAVVGSNTVTFNTLSAGAHTNCTITVTDSATNVSTALNVTSFTIESASWLGEYWTNIPSLAVPESGPTLTRNDDSINFHWGSGSPDPMISSNNFAARWTKTVYLPAGTYSFQIADADDGVLIYLDNSVIMGQWNDQGGYNETHSQSVSAGVHTFKVEYYENGGGASLVFNYAIVAAPDLAVVTPVPATVSETVTPEFTFSSSQNASISVGGSCASDYTSAAIGNNTISIHELSPGTYSDCTLTATTTGTELVSTLAIPSFTVTAAPVDVYVNYLYTSEGINDNHTWGFDAFTSVQAAIDSVAQNGTVHVAPGEYSESNSILISNKGALQLLGAGSNETYITSDSYPRVDIKSSGVKLDGFDISGQYNSGPVIRVFANVTGVTISHNKIHDGYRGIAFGGTDYGTPGSESIAEYNDIYNNDTGIMIEGNNNIIRYNNIHDSNDNSDNQAGIYLLNNGSSEPYGNQIRNNNIYDNQSNGIKAHDHPDGELASNIIDGNNIYNNGLSEWRGDGGNGPAGIELGGGENNADNFIVTNNVIVQNTWDGIRVCGSNNTFTGNIIGAATIGGVQYEGNREHAIKYHCGNNNIAHNNSFTGNGTGDAEDNTLNGILNSAYEEGYDNTIFNATGNWWGSNTGPRSDTNPGGVGEYATVGVNYSRFLTHNLANTTVNNLFANQIFVPQGGDVTETEEVNISNEGNTVITVPTDHGAHIITLPTGTIITKVGGGSFDASTITAQDIATSSVSGLTEGEAINGVLHWGITDLGLSFSNPITLSIFVGNDFDGQTLTVYRSTSSSSGWTQDGLVSTTCVVSSGVCTFQTMKASYFAAIGAGISPVVVSSPTPFTSSSSGLSRITYGCKDLNAINYSEFVSSDPSLCKYAPLVAQTQAEKIVAVSTVSSTFSRDLKKGMSGKDVKELQNFLTAQKVGPAALKLSKTGASGYFGAVTESALIEFQKSKKISPAAGYFGAKTRVMVK